MGSASLDKKVEAALALLGKFNKVLVAFSGGVDSSVALYLARRALGDNVLAVTVDAPSFTEAELERADTVAELIGAEQLVVAGPEFENEDYLANTPERCYHCKKVRYGALVEMAAEQGYDAVIDGVNADDGSENRPGHKAAEELRIVAPLASSGMVKEDVRKIAVRFNYPDPEAISNSCLSTRLPFGEKITPEKLAAIGRAEAEIRALGFRIVRVRAHGGLARLEVGADELNRFADPKLRHNVSEILKSCGYIYTAIDLEGYRTGSADEAVSAD